MRKELTNLILAITRENEKLIYEVCKENEQLIHFNKLPIKTTKNVLTEKNIKCKIKS